MSWIEVRTTLDPKPTDMSPFIELYRTYGIENTIEEGNQLSGCFVDVPATDAAVTQLEAALNEAGAASVAVSELPETDWSEVWKLHFKPMRIGERLVVCPTWEQFESKPGDVVIKLDPGQAFGTGDHATTKLCLAYVDSLVKPGTRVLDVGCGSGILSVAAKLLGAESVLGIDIEAVAVDVAKQNAALNGVDIPFIVGNGLDEVSEDDPPYDLVISNIISAVLIRLAAYVPPFLKPEGKWVVSGIIPANWPDVLLFANRAGFVLQDQTELDGWVAAVFSHTGVA